MSYSGTKLYGTGYQTEIFIFTCFYLILIDFLKIYPPRSLYSNLGLCIQIDLSGNYVTTNTVFNLGLEWISSLLLTGYGQRSRTSFFNTCLKRNFGFCLINVEIILSTKTRLNGHG